MAKANAKFTISAVDRTRVGLQSVKRGLSSVMGAVFSLKGALGITAGAAGMGYLVNASLKATDELGKTAKKLGVTTEALAGLRHAAALTGVQQETLNKALTKQQKAIFDADRGLLTYKQHFDALNLSTEELKKQSPDQQFITIADALNKLENQTQKNAIAYDVFGGRGTSLLNTLALGRDGLEAAALEAKELGLALSVDAVRGVEDANDNITRLTSLFRGLKDQTVAALAPAISEGVKMLKEWVLESSRAYGGVEGLAKATARGILTFVRDSIAGLGKFGDAVDNLLQRFGLKEAKDDAADLSRRLKGAAQSIQYYIGMLQDMPEKGSAYHAVRGVLPFVLTEEEVHKKIDELQAVQRDLFIRMQKLGPAAEQSINPAIAALDQLIAKLDQAASGGTGVTSGQVGADAGGEGAGVSDARGKYLADFQAQVAAKYEILNDSLMTEQERLRIHYENLAFDAEDAFQLGFATEAERKLLLEELEQQHQDKLKEIIKKGLTDVEKFKQQSYAMQTATVLGEISKMTAGVANSNKVLFNLNKIAAMSEAALSMRKTVVDAFEWGNARGGPKLGALMATIAGAAQAANIAAIANTNFGGGGVAPSQAGTGATDTVIAVPASTGGGGGSQVTRNITVNFGSDERLLSTSAARNLIEQLADEIRDMGGNVSLSLA